jgi:intracellular sulfur oxidation DsrE/DsrF family protein
MKTIVPAVLLTLALVFTAVSQTPKPAKHRVVFELIEAQGRDWDVLPIHVNNVRTAFEKDGGVQVEVVFYAAGLNMLLKKNAAYEERLKQLKDNGVTLAACQNAMKMMNVKSEDLFPFATEVDSGIAELVRKQEAGWAYIH